METSWGRSDTVKSLVGDMAMVFLWLLKERCSLMERALDSESEGVGLRLNSTTYLIAVTVDKS